MGAEVVRMNLWEQHERRRFAGSGRIILRFEPGVEPEFRRLCIRFVRWIRGKYAFPVSVRVYVKDCERVRLMSGAMAYGSFRWYGDGQTPYIRLPARVREGLREEYSDMDIYYSILSSLVHELTHCLQWAQALQQSNATSERQANYYRFRLIEQFCSDEGLPY